jgi:predicted DNA-binding protein
MGGVVMDKILVATRLEAQTFKALQDLAQHQERKVAYLVRKAVEQFITQTRKEAKGRQAI